MGAVSSRPDGGESRWHSPTVRLLRTSERGPTAGGGVSPRKAPTRIGPLAGLVFDAGDVLYDATVWRRRLLRLLSHMGLHTHYQDFYLVWQRDFLVDVHRGRCPYWDAFRTFLQSAGLSPGQVDEVIVSCHVPERQLEDGTRPLPGVPATLAQLAGRGLRLGVLTNAPYPADQIQEQLTRLGIGESFQTIVSSFDLGRTEPEACCYQAALSSLGLAARQVGFVGHDAQELRGASAVGMWTIAFNYDRDAQADIYLERFEHLLDVVPCPAGGMLAA